MKYIFALFAIFALGNSIYTQTNLDSLKSINIFESERAKGKINQTIASKEAFSNLDSTIKYSLIAERIGEKLKDDTLLGNVYNDLSIAHFVAGNFQKTVDFGEKSLFHRKKTKDSLAIASAYSKLGMGHQELGNLKDATKYYGIASEIFIKKNEVVKGAQIKNNMANIFERNDQIPEALKQAKEASAILWELKDTAKYTVTQANYGDILRKNGQLKESISVFNQLLPFAKQSVYKDFEGQIYQSLGLALYELGDTIKAEEYYRKAISDYQKHNSATGLALMHGNLGTVLFDKKQYQEAEKEFLAGLPYLEKSNSNIHKKLIYEGLYKINKQKGNAADAFKYSELYHAAKDSIYSQSQQKELLTLQKKFETEEKNRKIAEQEIEIANQELKAGKRNLIYLVSGISALALLIFGLLFFKNFKRKKELELKEKELNSRQEKLRISRDLHDHIGAELTLIKSRIDQRAFLSKDEKEKKELEEISDYSKLAIDQLRKTIWATKNDKIDLDNFVTNLENYVGRFPMKTKITENHKNYELSSVIALNLFRVCQETINNSVKYSGGNNLEISILESENKLSLILTDNGNGFDINNVSKGYGLSNMEERMKEIKGKFFITSNKKGTTTSLEVIK